MLCIFSICLLNFMYKIFIVEKLDNSLQSDIQSFLLNFWVLCHPQKGLSPFLKYKTVFMAYGPNPVLCFINKVVLEHMHAHSFTYCLALFGLPRWVSGKESTCQCRSLGFDPQVGKMSWSRIWQSVPVCLLGKSHGQRSLVGCIQSLESQGVGHD